MPGGDAGVQLEWVEQQLGVQRVDEQPLRGGGRPAAPCDTEPSASAARLTCPPCWRAGADTQSHGGARGRRPLAPAAVSRAPGTRGHQAGPAHLRHGDMLPKGTPGRRGWPVTLCSHTRGSCRWHPQEPEATGRPAPHCSAPALEQGQAHPAAPAQGAPTSPAALRAGPPHTLDGGGREQDQEEAPRPVPVGTCWGPQGRYPPAFLCASPACLRVQLSEPSSVVDEDGHISPTGDSAGQSPPEALRLTASPRAEVTGPTCKLWTPPLLGQQPFAWGSPVGEKRREVTLISGLK